MWAQAGFSRVFFAASAPSLVPPVRKVVASPLSILRLPGPKLPPAAACGSCGPVPPVPNIPASLWSFPKLEEEEKGPHASPAAFSQSHTWSQVREQCCAILLG